MDVNDFKSCLENESEMRQRMKWRYRLEWRDERRLRPLLQDWNSGWGYWLLTKGTVSEKLNLEMIERKHDATMEGLRIFDRLKDDGMPNTRRDRWKRQAMKRLATKHQEDYDSKDYEVCMALHSFGQLVLLLQSDSTRLCITGPTGRGYTAKFRYWTWF
jgi:hypothetical protein